MATRPRLYHTLYFRVIAGIVAVVAVAAFVVSPLHYEAVRDVVVTPSTPIQRH